MVKIRIKETCNLPFFEPTGGIRTKGTVDADRFLDLFGVDALYKVIKKKKIKGKHTGASCYLDAKIVKW